MTIEELGRLVQRSLKRSETVVVDGLGVFARNETGEICFERSCKPRVFIAYAIEDRDAADRLFNQLSSAGYAAWLDRQKLLPGEDWPHRIEDAIASSDFFIACFSGRSAKKRGGFHTELRHALDCASRMPLDDVFLIPVRLDECSLPLRIQREIQYVDLYPDWNQGFERILSIMEEQIRRAA